MRSVEKSPGAMTVGMHFISVGAITFRKSSVDDVCYSQSGSIEAGNYKFLAYVSTEKVRFVIGVQGFKGSFSQFADDMTCYIFNEYKYDAYRMPNNIEITRIELDRKD
jgi:hypothetical protein